MLRRVSWIVFLASTATLIATSISAQQAIYWKKDHIYNGPGGKEVAVMTPAPSDQTVPSTPAGLGYSSVTATSVQLSWSASTDSGGSGLAGYKVYRRYGSNAALPVGTVGPSVLSFTDQPLVPSTSYIWTVVAFDNAQNHSSPSSAVTVSTSSASGDNIAPTPPVDVIGQALAFNQIRLNWHAATDAGGSGLAGYKVYRGGTLVSGSSPIAATTFTDTGLSANTAYSYTLTALDVHGNTSTATSPVTVTTPLELLFTDNFNRPNSDNLGAYGTSWYDLYQGYYPSSTFSVNSLQALCNGPSNCLHFAQASATKLRLQVDVAVNTGGGVAFWNYNDGTGPQQYYIAYMMGGTVCTGVYVWGPWAGAGGTCTDQSVDPIAAITGTLRVEADGTTGRIQVFVNNALILDWTDGPRSYPRTGGIGIWSSSGQRLDNFSAYRLP